MPLDLSRRGFLSGLGTLLVAAPAIVRITSIMPVKVMPDAVVLEARLEPEYLAGDFIPPMTVWDGKVYQAGAWWQFGPRPPEIYSNFTHGQLPTEA